MDQRPIHFIKNYHDPQQTGTVQRIMKNGTSLKVQAPSACTDYNQYMGGCDNNNQVTRLNKTCRLHRWPRSLMVKFFLWACYNAYITMDHFNPLKRAGKRYRTFTAFMSDICLQLVRDFRTAAVRRTSRADNPERLQNVGLHMPI